MKSVLAALLLLATEAGADPGKPDAAGVEAAAQRWIDAYLAADLDRLMTLYTDDATVALHGQPKLSGAAAVRAYFAPRIGQVDASFQIGIESIEVDGDTAWLISKYWMEGRENGEAVFRDAGRSLLIYRWSPERGWLIHVDIDQATPDVAFPAPATDPEGTSQ